MYIGTNEAKLYYDAYKNRIEISVICPDCGEKTRLKKCYAPVETEEKTVFECEHCNSFFYGEITVKMSAMSD